MNDSLHEVAREGDVVALTRMLGQGADLEARDGQGWTPLHWAARKGHLEVVRLLLDRGADRKARGKDGETPADLASGAGHYIVAAELRPSSTMRRIFVFLGVVCVILVLIGSFFGYPIEVNGHTVYVKPNVRNLLGLIVLALIAFGAAAILRRRP